MKSVIGILAGMGPRSTAPFLERVLDFCQELTGAVYDAEFPEMVVVSLPTPFRPERPYDTTEMLQALSQGLDRLKHAGAQFIAIPCNTVHVHFQQMQSMVNVPLLSIVEEAAQCLEPTKQRVALLGTKPLVHSNLYQRVLSTKNLEGIVTPTIQAGVDACLMEIKRNGFSAKSKSIWAKLIDDVVSEGAEQLLIACTDLSPLAFEHAGPLPVVCSTSALAKATVRRWMQ